MRTIKQCEAECKQVDLERNLLLLDTSKNGEARTGPMTPRMRELITACMAGKQKPTDPLFTRAVRRDGKRIEVPIGNFREAWRTACIRCGLGRYVCRACGADLKPKAKGQRRLQCEACGSTARKKYVGLIFHDLRRSAATNLYRAGVDRDTIRELGGWKTNAMFERYKQNFPDKRAPRAMAALTEYLAAEQAKAATSEADKLILGQIKLMDREKRPARRLPAAPVN